MEKLGFEVGWWMKKSGNHSEAGNKRGGGNDGDAGGGDDKITGRRLISGQDGETPSIPASQSVTAFVEPSSLLLSDFCYEARQTGDGAGWDGLSGRSVGRAPPPPESPRGSPSKDRVPLVAGALPAGPGTCTVAVVYRPIPPLQQQLAALLDRPRDHPLPQHGFISERWPGGHNGDRETPRSLAVLWQCPLLPEMLFPSFFFFFFFFSPRCVSSSSLSVDCLLSLSGQPSEG